MQKNLILVRHAHRDKLSPRADNGLSQKGLKQAKLIAKFYKKQFGKTPALLLSSPKKRCMETLAPLAGELGVPVEIASQLDESRSLEDLKTGFEIIKRRWYLSKDPLMVVCSHGDVLPEFFESLIQQRIELSKGAWAQIEGSQTEPLLTWLIQDFGLL